MLTAFLPTELATEMLQDRYKVPAARDPKSLLARHEAGIFEENSAMLTSSAHPRSNEVNKLILPQCQAIIEAMGHRMAYDAAVAAGVQQPLIDLYVVSCVKLDTAWYIENAGMTRKSLADMENKVLDAVLPRLDALIKAMGVEPWITSKIISDERWNDFIADCQVFDGQAKVSVFQGEGALESQVARPHL